MKLVSQAEKMVSHGTEEALFYKVANSPHMMRLLSTNLYQDHIKAPIRELSTNGWDAQVENDRINTPMTIHIPTWEEPYFSIRDFGTGMSEYDITNMYRTYGISDKGNTNELQGCLGLGSKSSFAYTSSFTSTSFFNGKKYVFINSKDKFGRPTISKVSEEDTNQPNGFSVQFAVQKADISRFERSIKEVYRWFPVKPKTNIDIDFLEYEVIIDGSDWKLLKTPQYHYGNKNAIAIMGYVEYPIDPSKFEPEQNDDDETPKWHHSYKQKNPEIKYVEMLNKFLQLNFEIGEIEFDTGREKLQYTDRTVNAIKTKLDHILTEQIKSVENAIKNCKTLWEARCKLTEVCRVSFLQDIIKNESYTWNEQNVESIVDIQNSITLRNMYTCELKAHKYKTKYSQYYNRMSAEATEDLRFILNDTKSAGISASKRIMEEQNIDHVIILGLNFNEEGKRQKTKISDIQKFLDYAGVPSSDIILASSAPKPQKQTRTTASQPTAGNGYLFTYVTPNNRDSWKRTSIDITKGGIYVVHKGGYWQSCMNLWKTYNNSNKAPYKLKHLISCLVTIHPKISSINDVIIYGVSPRLSKSLVSNLKWENIDEYLKRTLKELFPTKIEISKVDNLSYDNTNITNMLSLLNGELPNTHKINTLLHSYKTECYISNLEDLKEFCPDTLTIKQLPLKKELEKIKRTYPLLPYLSTPSKGDYKSLAEYILLIDKQRNREKKLQLQQQFIVPEMV